MFLDLKITEQSLKTVAKVLPKTSEPRQPREGIPHFFCKRGNIRIYENLTVLLQKATIFLEGFYKYLQAWSICCHGC